MYNAMIRHVSPYVISLGLHLTGFFLVGLIANHRNLAPPVLIDFTVNAAHASVEQQTTTPATPKARSSPKPQPRTEAPQLPQPTPVKPVHEKSVQNVSEVAVAQRPLALPLAQAAPTASPAPSPGEHHDGAKSSANSASSGGGGNGSAEEARTKYVKEQFTYIRDKIASHVRYPRHARRMGWSGTAQVSFVIEENGSVSDVRIVRSSRVGMLDDEAMDSVRRSSPFPRPPVRARVVIPIEYVLG